MLISFRIQNYRSIVDLVVAMTYAERKAPNGYREMAMMPFIEKAGLRFVPLLGVYGPNASGKSNIVQAFALLESIVGGRYDGSSQLTNRLQNVGDTATFTIDFATNSHRYRYQLEVSVDEIVGEQLHQDYQLVFSARGNELKFNEMLEKGFSESKLNTIHEVECLDWHKQKRVTLLGVLGKNYAEVYPNLVEVHTYLSRQIIVYSNSSVTPTQGLERLIQMTGRAHSQEALDEISSFLQKFDIDIKRIEGKEVDSFSSNHLKDGIAYDHRLSELYTIHKGVDGREVRLSLAQESAGTQRLIGLLAMMLSTLKRGGLLIVDDIDISLHPLVLVEILKLFKERRYNRSGAQLIFTTHDTEALDQQVMRVSEIGITEKTARMGTQFTRISDFSGVRNVTSFGRQYLAGRFRGIPFPYI